MPGFPGAGAPLLPTSNGWRMSFLSLLSLNLVPEGLLSPFAPSQALLEGASARMLLKRPRWVFSYCWGFLEVLLKEGGILQGGSGGSHPC